MYGLIVKLTAAPGRRDDLITLMGGADSATVPGCLSFIVAEDASNPDVLWMTEVWKDQASHQASLQAPPIQSSLGQAEHLIAAFEQVATTAPVAGSSHPLHPQAPQNP